jgi:hypothetical protein
MTSDITSQEKLGIFKEYFRTFKIILSQKYPKWVMGMGMGKTPQK